MSPSDLNELIAAWLDGRISETQSQALQQRLLESTEARDTFRELTRLDAALREIASSNPSVSDSQTAAGRPLNEPTEHGRQGAGNRRVATWIQLACAAAMLLVVGGLAYQFGKSDAAKEVAQDAVATNNAMPREVGDDSGDEAAEQTIAGHATLRRNAGIEWANNAKAFREGDVLPAGVLEFEDGVAEIDFFCGAAVIVEGPAKLDLESDWSVRLISGRLRANVPPAARGFIVKAADSQIIDLGTEFALDVGADNVRVEVVDGEVKLKGGRHDGDHLVTGQGRSLKGDDAGGDLLQDLSTKSDVERRHEKALRERFQQWRTHCQELANDDRLIAYFPIAAQNAERVIDNAAATGPERDGIQVGLVSQSTGRFGPLSASVGFDRPGSRVRTRIDGEYKAFTFCCWIRVDSLEHRYNSLFMGDGYDNGEPHWQIRDDGRLMFSVMVDDTVNVPRFDKTDQRVITTAGLHHIYYTEPFMDGSQSGQWFQVAAVYDPIGRTVDQYVNGDRISSEKIIDKFHISDLRIGAAEIGNWGQPLRKSPWFAVRNLNGAIDELAIFDAALSPEEIKTMYEKGKPLGY
ncbi:MAG: hypothetical protein HKN47_29130 [Pirellulaceae bacterium]|nr:hypothetical protein [Pirellulaceae bacterium]